jgi:DNA-binding GntR family transcriptional regulator
MHALRQIARRRRGISSSLDSGLTGRNALVYKYVAMGAAHPDLLRRESRHPSAQEQAYVYLRRAILSGKLQGGARLRQDAIAEHLRISRIPVRDALGRLHAEGLVTLQSNRSMVVTELGPAEVMEIFEIRAALEGLALRLALPHLRGEVLHEIDDLLRRMNRVVDDTETWIERHEAFHEYLHNWSGRPRLVAQIRQLRAAVQPYLRLYVEWKTNPERHGYEHESIVAAVLGGNPREVDEIMRGHVMRTATKVTEFLGTVREGALAPSTPTGSRSPT